MAENKRSQAKEKAKAWKSQAGKVISKSDVESWAESKQAAGKERPDVTKYLERQLSKGASLGSAVVNRYNRGGYDRGTEALFGTSSPNITGLSGLNLSKGQVYSGAARVGDGGTAPIILPRALVKSMRQPQAQPAPVQPAPVQPAAPSPTSTTRPNTPVAPASAQPREELSGKFVFEVPHFAARYLPGTSASRQQARRESLNLASQSSQKNVVSGGQLGIRDFYTKEFAKFGNNPNVFGMQDLLQMENTGASGGEIARTALTIGSIGPEARKRLASKYGITL